jgi:hypothetical protein
MGTRDDIRERLGIFAKATFNCGVGPDGFEPGNTCGADGGSGSAPAKDSTRKPAPSKHVEGIEQRARAAGRSFTEQWVHEQRSAIAKGAEQKERRRQRSAERAAEKVREIEGKIAELKARGPQPPAAQSPRMAEISGNIAALDARLAEVTKTRDEARAKADAIAKEQAASAERMAEAKRRLEESKARSRALSRALRGL